MILSSCYLDFATIKYTDKIDKEYVRDSLLIGHGNGSEDQRCTVSNPIVMPIVSFVHTRERSSTNTERKSYDESTWSLTGIVLDNLLSAIQNLVCNIFSVIRIYKSYPVE